MISFTPNIDRDGFILQSDQPITLLVHHNLEKVSDPDRVFAFLYKGMKSSEAVMDSSGAVVLIPEVTYDSDAQVNEGLLDGQGRPLDADLWDQLPGPEIQADYIPALDGTAAVRGPSDAHPELALPAADIRSTRAELEEHLDLEPVRLFEQNHVLDDPREKDDPRQDWLREQDELMERIDALRGNREFIRRLEERVEADQVLLRRIKDGI